MLLRALSSQSVTVQHLVAGKEFGSKKSNVKAIAGEKAAQSAFVGLFGAPTPSG